MQPSQIGRVALPGSDSLLGCKLSSTTSASGLATLSNGIAAAITSIASATLGQ